MTNGENQALLIANKYNEEITNEEMVKHLATEVVELAIALEKGDKANIKEEVGDCLFLLLHIISRHDELKESLSSLCVMASEKMEMRYHNQKIGSPD